LGGVASKSLSAVIWVLLGVLGLFINAILTIFRLVTIQTDSPWGTRESVLQRIFLSMGVVALLLLGLFPQWTLIFWTKLPAIFTNFGQ